MGWKATDVMDQKTEFTMRAVKGLEPMAQLCREFGISRKTGYKWKQRFLDQGLPGLQDDSRRPKTCSHGLDEDTVCRIIELKHAHPKWGPKKLQAIMQRCGERNVPSLSSFKRVLEKVGLVEKRRRRPVTDTGRLESPAKSTRPNHVWTIDFKGWWQTRDRHRFEPLTVRDDYSRYLLCARSLNSTSTEHVREQMELLFEAFGLPEVIRSDNGPPFAASNSPMGLSRLSVWWLTLGISLDRIRPGKPQENGGHERMHRDISVELQQSARSTAPLQQASLDVWRERFNQERPHESLGMRVPADVYTKSATIYNQSPVDFAYLPGILVRRVYGDGRLKIRNQTIQVSKVFVGFNVGLESLCERHYAVWFGDLRVGEIDLQTLRFTSSGGSK